jgi:hypothetical protein
LRRLPQAKPETDMHKLQSYRQSTPFQPLASQSSDSRNATLLPSQLSENAKVIPTDHEPATAQDDVPNSNSGCSELLDFSNDNEEELPTSRSESFKWDRAEGYRRMDTELKRVVYQNQIVSLELVRN